MDLKIKDNSELKLGPFTQLEYIESTGTQWIDTGVKADNNNQTFKIGVSFLSNLQYIGSNELNRPQATSCIFRNTSNALAINWGTWSSDGSVLQSNYPLETLAEIEIKAGNVVKLNGNNTAITAQDVSFSSGRTANFTLNGFSDAASDLIKGYIVRTHYFIVEDNGIETIHLIPVINNSNNTVCMYDTVSKTFFYNQGTGNFIAGPVIDPGLPENIILKTTTLYHKNTPNVDGLQLLGCIFNTQEDVVLNRIRVDIGNVSGPISELLQYSSMAGFNDNYEPQAKPRLVGTWTVNDWYTTAQLNQARQTFDGLTIIENPSYVIDFDKMAVQVLDDTQPNYNPAVAIILQAAGYGNTLDEPPIPGQTGRWFITNTQFESISFGTIFSQKTTVVDTNNIIDGGSYDFDHIELSNHFMSMPNFQYCTKLKRVIAPNVSVLRDQVLQDASLDFLETKPLSSIGTLAITTVVNTWYMHGTYEEYLLSHQFSKTKVYLNGTLLAGNIVIPNNITSLGAHIFQKLSDITSIDTGPLTTLPIAFCSQNPNLTTLIIREGVTTLGGGQFFYGCYNIEDLTLPSTITNLGEMTFRDYTKPVTILATTPPTILNPTYGFNNTIYVPDSAVNDYKNSSYWSSLANKIKPLSEKPV